MFTGLVEAVGVVESVVDSEVGRELRIRAPWNDLGAGESIAVNGACLTVREFGEGWFSVAAVSTTLGRTNIGAWAAGTHVNLERSLRLGDRLGGHLVQGHVDGLGVVKQVVRRDSALLIDVEVPPEVAAVLIPQGSVTVDGVSLTVNARPRDELLQVSIIDHTERHTTLGTLQPGDRVHLEGDVIGKFVRALAGPWLPQAPG